MRCLPVILVLLLPGCANTRFDELTCPCADMGKEFTLPLGRAIPMAGKNYSIIFEKVLEDSRCPTGVTCIWEGNARIQLTMRVYSSMGTAGDGGPLTETLDVPFELNTSPRFPTTEYDKGLVMELRRLEPAPRQGVQTSGYVATLIARKK